MIPVYLPELDPANQERTYVKVSHNGAHCIMEPREAEALVACASIDDECEYELSEVSISPAEFEKLPEFSGW